MQMMLLAADYAEKSAEKAPGGDCNHLQQLWSSTASSPWKVTFWGDLGFNLLHKSSIGRIEAYKCMQRSPSPENALHCHVHPFAIMLSSQPHCARIRPSTLITTTDADKFLFCNVSLAALESHHSWLSGLYVYIVTQHTRTNTQLTTYKSARSKPWIR